jgi:hypothetical protein
MLNTLFDRHTILSLKFIFVYLHGKCQTGNRHVLCIGKTDYGITHCLYLNGDETFFEN